MLLHSELQRRDLQPNQVSLTSLMQAYVRGRRWIEAMQCFKSNSDWVALSAVMDVAAKTQRWSQVLALWRSFHHMRVGLTLCDVAIDACSGSTQWKEALELFGELESKASRMSLLSYCAAVGACEKADPTASNLAAIVPNLSEACGQYLLSQRRGRNRPLWFRSLLSKHCSVSPYLDLPRRQNYSLLGGNSAYSWKILVFPHARTCRVRYISGYPTRSLHLHLAPPNLSMFFHQTSHAMLRLRTGHVWHFQVQFGLQRHAVPRPV